ncbi:MAG: hypothetical protein IJ877_00885 [Candidatus Gastranaerophilales bacterium]|nr:hypothetical protein [Candidatus Gastranaerophilales bacterium]
MSEKVFTGLKDDFMNTPVPRVTQNPIANDSTLLSYYTGSKRYNESEIFDKFFAQGLELMGGDKLLKPASALNSVTIRKTTTPGLYKLISNKYDNKCKIEYIDEGQLLNNREYCKATVSMIDVGMYEVTYFDDDDEIVIEHYSKEEVIDFMNKNKLVFQT